MDIDFMKSAAQDHMEMMLLQMEKHPDFAAAFDDDSDDGNNHHNPMTASDNLFETFNVQSPAFDDFHVHPPDMPLSGVSHHDPTSFQTHPSSGGGGGWGSDGGSGKRNSMAAMREMIFRIAAMQPVHIDPESVKRPKRKNVKISTDPQSVAARHRRERISERIRILQRLVPGGTKMDTASMLDEAIHYVKFLKSQVQSLERVAVNRAAPEAVGVGFPVPMSSGSYFPTAAAEKGYRQYPTPHNVQY